MSTAWPHDAFKDHRQRGPVLPTHLDGEDMPMILGYREVRQAANDWSTFSNDAPFRVPIPAEDDVRSVRQLPIETDPPLHTDYRALVEPFFKRPRQPEYVAKVEALMEALLDAAVAMPEIEVVRQFALPLQSRSLTYLLNVPESEADEWIGWGTHVFRDGNDGERKGKVLEDYIRRRFAQAKAAPDRDLFSALNEAMFQGRPLTDAEKEGFANLTFAGGRDTIINSVVNILGYLAAHPETMGWLVADPRNAVTATEEFLRVTSPLTHIGRVCPAHTDVGGTPVEPGGRVSLCWAAANHDEAFFPEPEAVRLDRKPNPHIAFGSGTHACLGADHARLLLRTLLRKVPQRLERLEEVAATPKVERERDYQRIVGYESLVLRLHPRTTR